MRYTLLLAAAAAVTAQELPIVLRTCSASNGTYSRWHTDAKNSTIVLNQPLGGTTYCMDIENYSTDDNATVWTYACTGTSNQQWNVSGGAIQSMDAGHKCLYAWAAPGAPVYEGTQVSTLECNAQDPRQSFSYNAATGTITHTPTGFCIDAGAPYLPCQFQPSSSLPFCNPSLSFKDRVADLVSRIQPQEKADLFNTASAGVPSLQIPAIQWWSEALHGVGGSPGVTFQAPTPWATSFPQVIHTSQSFNKSLWLAIGQTISTEARAMNNVGNAGLTFWAPNLNIFRDPRWGRGQETPGEDPIVTSEYVRHFVRGMQEGDDPRFLKVSSCCKHYAAYSLENWEGIQRYGFNAFVTDQDLVDTYLPAFQACVSDARASGMMCSYNAVATSDTGNEPIPACANGFLMNTIARGEFQFDGYITSDCGAVGDIQSPHNYVNNSIYLPGVTLPAGMDIGCDSQPSASLDAALNASLVSMEAVDTALSHLFMVRMRLGQFDPPASQPYRQIPPSVVCSAPHQALSTDASRQGVVLLSNPKKVLPLNKGAIKTIAAVGPNANNGGLQLGNYQGTPCGGYGNITSISGGLAAYGAVTYQQGCGINDTSTNGFAAAIAAAQAADVTVVVIGLDEGQESEGNDRYFIELPGQQPALVQQVCAAAKGPCIVVSMSGGATDLSGVMADPNVAALVHIGYIGEDGGTALAQVLFGDAVPAGRLTQTIYPAAFTSQVSLFEMNMRPGVSQYPPGSSPGRTYRFYTGTPVVPFGFGLSYTTFSYSAAGPAAVSMAPVHAYLAANARYNGKYAPLHAGTAVEYTVNVTNTGTIDADDVVLGFLTPPGAGQNGVPLQQLFGFERVFVPAGQTVTVFLGLDARHLTQISTEGKRVAVPGEYKVHFGVRETAALGMGYTEARFTAA